MPIKDTIRNIKDSSKLLSLMYYLYKKPAFAIKSSKAEKSAQARKSDKSVDEKYSKLLSMKNTKNGKRCFIVCTGPSLTIEDLELIKDEDTFGMNSICKLFDKTEWRPTYYGIQDVNVYENMKDVIEKNYSDKNNVFISSDIAEKFGANPKHIQFPYNSAYHDAELQLNKFFAKFSDDCYSIVYDGYSVTYSLIQIAMYMGYSEIYLLGADCSYKKGQKNHIVESGFIDINEEKNYIKMTTSYNVAKEYCQSNNFKIFNCTRGGMLEVFERKNLEDVLNEK